MKRIGLVDIFIDDPLRYAAISAPNARCVYIDESVCNDDSYEIRGDYLIGSKESNSFYDGNGIFAIYEKTNEGYKEVGLFCPSSQKVENLPTWIKTDLLMKELTEKINS